jgi:two-component system response regulator YesN
LPSRLLAEKLPDISQIYNLVYLRDTIMLIYTLLAEYYSNADTRDMYERILQYVQENYNSVLSLEVIASQFGITQVYLSSYFKKMSGGNLSSYISKVRIDAAIELLQGKKQLRINDVAEMVGIPNTNTFIIQFKKFTGVTPDKYKREYHMPKTQE